MNHKMILKNLDTPCRNFCILGATRIPCDPYDQQEKYVLTNYAAGGIGQLILINTHTLESECFAFPGDEGAWAILYLPDEEALIIGTCATRGFLHRFNLRSRTFLTPLRLESETYLWNFALAKDGNVYASTFPGCNLVCYNPKLHQLTCAKRVGSILENQYSRFVYRNTDGNILVNSGYSVIEAFLYDVDRHELIPFGDVGDSIQKVTDDYILVLNEAQNLYKLYAPDTLERIGEPIDKDTLEYSESTNEVVQKAIHELMKAKQLPSIYETCKHIIPMSDRRIMGIRGQELLLYSNGKEEYIRIPAKAPATTIMTLAIDENDTIWGSCEFGQTIFSYEPNTHVSYNTAAVADAGGEVYGIVPIKDKLYLTSYVGGDHILYQPHLPWNQHDNINPKLLGSVAPDMVRPHGKSVLGPDGNVWTGWCASYGVYGGGFTRINTKTEEVTSWFPYIKDQAIECLHADSNYLYAITSGEASGLPHKEDSYYILCLDSNCQIVWKQQYPIGVHFQRIRIHKNHLVVSMIDTTHSSSQLVVLDPLTGELMSTIFLGDYSPTCRYQNVVTEMQFIDSDLLLLFLGGEIRIYSLAKQACIDKISHEIDGICETCVLGRKGQIYFSIKENLYELYRRL